MFNYKDPVVKPLTIPEGSEVVEDGTIGGYFKSRKNVPREELREA